jgi:hypothetical protein
MSESNDPRRNAAEKICAVMLEARRNIGDVALCDALDLLAEGLGQNKYNRHAGAVIGGTTLGRRAIDDRQALRRIALCPPSRRHEAAGIEARLKAGADASDKQVDAIAHRLRRKLRENQTDKLVLSAAPVE